VGEMGEVQGPLQNLYVHRSNRPSPHKSRKTSGATRILLGNGRRETGGEKRRGHILGKGRNQNGRVLRHGKYYIWIGVGDVFYERYIG